MSPIPLLVTADDFGLTAATSDAILDAHDHGIVTATSVLALAPRALDQVSRLAERTRLGVGVHLALVGEDLPLCPAADIPTLVDERGRLAPSWRHLVLRAAARRIDPEDVRRECQAQIDAVRGAGVDPTHLDTHQHVHLWPSIGAVVVELARAEGIGRIRVPRPTRRTLRNRAIGALADRLARSVADARLAATERFAGLDQAGGWSSDGLIAELERLAAEDTGSVEINLHPGRAQDPDRDRYAWGYAWGAELAAATDPGVRATIDRLGFALDNR